VSILTGVAQVVELDDAEVVARVLAGERERYTVLVERYQQVLFRHALGMVRDADQAADLVQDAFVRAYAQLARCRDPERFGGWVFRILANRCRDYLKSAGRRGVPLDGSLAAPRAAEADRMHEERELSEVLARALETLPAAQREALLLKHVEECSYEEMAERLGASVSALKMRVMRAREALQAFLGDSVP
jgi:RNA polymerase sigma-70 factor (ECF subfamily)